MIKAILQRFASRFEHVGKDKVAYIGFAEGAYKDALKEIQHAFRVAYACGIYVPIPGEEYTGFLDPYADNDKHGVFTPRNDTVAVQAHADTLQAFADIAKSLNSDDAFEWYMARQYEEWGLPSTASEAYEQDIQAIGWFSNAESGLKNSLQTAADAAKAYADTLRQRE